MVGSWRTAGLEVSVVCEAGQWTLAARLTSTHLDAIWGAPLVPSPWPVSPPEVPAVCPAYSV